MMKALVVLICLPSMALAYVPTVESIYRNGANPEVTASGVVLNLHIKKLSGQESKDSSPQDASLLKEGKSDDYYKLYFNKNGDTLKVSQARFGNSSYSENTLEHKTYYPNFSPYTIKGTTEELEKGLFFSLLNSVVFNNGAHVVNYLKSLGVPVRLNNDIINREKIEYLASYKRYLASLAKDRGAKKTEQNPLKPEDPVARARIESVMAGPMYVDTKHVKLGREDGSIGWIVDAGGFHSVVSYENRHVQKMNYKSDAGEFEMICKDYWLANGTHRVPRFILIKTLSGESYQVEITNMRHYVEREDDLVSRLTKWEQLLKGKTSTEPRPEFLL